MEENTQECDFSKKLYLTVWRANKNFAILARKFNFTVFRRIHHFWFWRESQFYNIGGKENLRFWRENMICWKTRFLQCVKYNFCGFGVELNFTLFTGKQDFVVLVEISILRIWREK